MMGLYDITLFRFFVLSHCFVFLFFIFFFKQKTAYEMRISDWSSDVCSSDLATCPLLRGCSPVQRAKRSSEYECQLAKIGFQQLAEMAARHQIGRASCRERVCQYV